MRTTVGPLPPAVYWRRRMAVLGVLIAAIALLVYQCSGGEPSGKAQSGPPGTGPSGSATPLLTPVVGAAETSAGPTGPPAQQTGPCADDEIQVSVATESGRTEFTPGAFVRIYLKIKNVSTRTCTRDVGALAQELRIQQGAQKLWSSDDCATGSTPAPDLHSFRPGEQMDGFNVLWNGRSSTDCQAKPVAPVGTYQVVGRFGTRHSDPLAITVKA